MTIDEIGERLAGVSDWVFERLRDGEDYETQSEVYEIAYDKTYDIACLLLKMLKDKQ